MGAIFDLAIVGAGPAGCAAALGALAAEPGLFERFSHVLAARRKDRREATLFQSRQPDITQHLQFEQILARRMAGSFWTDQPKARLATASEDRSETVLGTTGPDHARTPLSYSP